MFRNFIKVAFRNIWRQKGYALINILGLAIGLATSILIFLFVLYEKRYDRYHANAGYIYRIYTEGRMADTEFKGPITAVASAPVFNDEIPEVVNFTRLDRSQNVLIRHGDKTYLENNFLWADSGFFEIFSFQLISGDPSRVLKEPRSMVISQSTAKRYFGNEDPVGRVLEVFRDSVDYIITGVMQDIPGNSHFQGDFVVDFQSHHRVEETQWTGCNIHAYLQVREGTRLDELEPKMDAITREHVGPELHQALGVSFEDWERAGNYFRFRAQPLKDIHLNPDIQDDMQPSSDKKYIYIFSLVAIFIVSMACINFLNLSTARSAARAREVGLRKVAGSGRGMLVRQFLAESFIMVLIGMLIALLAVELILPVFNEITRLNLSLNYFREWYIVPGLMVFALIVGLMAGSYPAFFLASFKPVSVMSGKLTAGARSGLLRSLLVIVQFGLSIFIILCTLVITKHLRYLLDKDLGFDSDQIVVLERFNEIGKDRVETFKQEIAKISGVISSASSTMVPGHSNEYTGHMIEGRPADQIYLLHLNYIDYDYPETYGLKITRGRFHNHELTSDSEGIVINDTAVRNFNIQDPLASSFIKPDRENRIKLPVIGVMRDIHIQPLHTEVLPYMMRIRSSDWGWVPYLSIRLEPQNYKTVLNSIEDIWKSFTAGQPMRYFFLDDDFEQHYQQERRTSIIFMAFSVFAILVACLGLLGLTSFSTEKRAREIGIRKALGSSSASIVRLLSQEILLLIGISVLIAWPAAWYFSRNWLNDFAYRIDLTVMPFVVSLTITILIALLTISFQAVRAAFRNPADSLRYE
jgi:putative ABC transport system permease protein